MQHVKNVARENVVDRVVEFVKWVFHLRLAIGSSSLRLSSCSGESEETRLDLFCCPERPRLEKVDRKTTCRKDEAF